MPQTAPQLLIVGLLTWGIFVSYLFVNLPVPGPGEAYYLTKAKHYWDSHWVQGDFFLESASTHQFFYLTWGWLTCIFDLATTAIIGRVASMGIVAWGLTRFVSRFCNSSLTVLAINCVFLAIQASVDLADEWVVGGFEAKVITFGLIFLAWSYLAERHYFTASMIFGFAINTHVVVGGWALILTVGSLCCLAFQSREFINWKRIVILGIASILAASPGLISTLNALDLPEQAETSIGLLTGKQLQFHANYLMVIHRLPHHLDPGRWEIVAMVSYGLMLLLTLLGIKRTIMTSSIAQELPLWKFAFWFTWGSLMLIVIGGLLGYRIGAIAEMPGLAWRINLLKYYWFRVPDIWIPLTCSVVVLTRLSLRPNSKAMMTLAIIFALLISFVKREHPGHGFDPSQKQAWLETCTWIKTHTPGDSVFITPKVAWSFTWFAERKEYVTFKNCPQDAVSLVEWNHRLKTTDNWLEHVNRQNSVTKADIIDLKTNTHADYLITSGQLPGLKTASYQNQHFAIYPL